MLTILLLACVLVWTVLLFHHMISRGFTVLLIWLLIAPVASNVFIKPGSNPLFQTPSEYDAKQVSDRMWRRSLLRGESTDRSTVNLQQLLEPTRTLLLAFFLVFILEALSKRQALGRCDTTELLMGAFCFIMLASIFLKSYHLNYSMRIALDAFLVPFLTYFIVRRLVTQEGHFRQLIQVVGYLSVYLIVLGCIERLIHPDTFYRLGGPFREEGVFYIVLTAGYIISLLDACVSQSLPQMKPMLPRSIRCFVLGLAPVIILLTWERGNWVGFLMGVWGFVLLGYRLLNLPRKIVFLGLVLTLMPILVIGAVMLTPEEVITERVGRTKSISGRLETWRVTIEIGLKHPVLGIGFNNSGEALLENVLKSGGVNYVSAHNSYLALFAEQGIVGLSIYLAMIASIILTGMRLYSSSVRVQDRWRGVAVIAMMISHLAPALFASKLHLPRPWNTILVYSFVGGIAGLYGSYRYERLHAVPTIAVPTDGEQLADDQSAIEPEPLRHDESTVN